MIQVNKHIGATLFKHFPRRKFDTYVMGYVVKPWTESILWFHTLRSINAILWNHKNATFEDLYWNHNYSPLYKGNPPQYVYAKHSLAVSINKVFRKTLSALNL